MNVQYYFWWVRISVICLKFAKIIYTLSVKFVIKFNDLS